jgi:hypothetical protein
MKTAAIKLKRYSMQARVARNNDFQVRIFQSLMFGLGVLTLFYVLVLGNMVFNIVERKSLEADARNIGNEVGEMELTYLTMLNKVDISYGKSLGFKEAKATFATRKAVGTLPSSSKVKIANNDL